MNSASSTQLDHGPSMAANHRYSLPSGHDGSNGAPTRPGAGPLPHIDDVIAIPKDIDPNLSIKRLLEMAETSLRQAEMSRDLNRPAQALKDFIRASVIAVQLVRDHKDYLTVRDSGELASWHSAVLKKIGKQNMSFAEIKQDIVLDNKRSGVQPSAYRHASPASTTHSRPSSSSGRQTPLSNLSQELTNGNTGKVKPIVHPKPEALHGKSIKPGHARAGSLPATAQDTLLARFANLKGPQASPGQDPRIKTHPIPLPKPSGPREMVLPDKPKLSLKSNVPTLPKLPDAIYSPARGNGEGTRAPASTTRPRFPRTGSSTSLSSVQQTPVEHYQSSAPNYRANMDDIRPARAVLKIPDGDTITPEQLYQAMKAKGSYLLIDVRTRDDFSEGHIMSSATICVESSILTREDLSADQIAESLVLSPNQEHVQFENRNSYELVVFYDQDSKCVPSSPKTTEDRVLLSLRRALVDYNFGKELKNSPKLLEGGLDAWIDLMGPASLQTTSSPMPSGLGRRRKTITERKKQVHKLPTLRPDEAKKWREWQDTNLDDTGYVRTTEDFLRRFPAIPSEQESMTAPVAANRQPVYSSPYPIHANHDLPMPPTRPAPAMPRPSYSGARVTDDDDASMGPPKKTLSRANTLEQGAVERAKITAGIKNPRNWCYAISIIQALCASPNFGRVLADWNANKSTPPVPIKDEDLVATHPQLMVRGLGNHFHWMKTGHMPIIDIKRFMEYVKFVDKDHSGSRSLFGSDDQQDAQEFMSFLFTHLHDETNVRRNRKGIAPQPDTKCQSLVQAASEYWTCHSILNDSLVDRRWRGIDLTTTNCLECGNNTYSFNIFESITVNVPLGRQQKMTLKKALTEYCAPNDLDDFVCDTCRRRTRAKTSISLARMPSLLTIVFNRFDWDSGANDVRKSLTSVTWDWNDLDLSPYFLRPEDAQSPPTVHGADDKAYTRPFRYECYAVVVHVGATVDTGHYYTYIRDHSTSDQYAWLQCNDDVITRVRIGSGDRDDVQKDVFHSKNNGVPYLALFRRK